MRRLYGGVVLATIGTAVLIELHAHESDAYPLIRHHHVVRLEIGGWGGYAFGLAKLAAWALILVGALLFTAGLIARARRSSPAVS